MIALLLLQAYKHCWNIENSLCTDTQYHTGAKTLLCVPYAGCMHLSLGLLRARYNHAVGNLRDVHIYHTARYFEWYKFHFEY